MNQIFDKIKGSLMGGAIGDALGYEIEFVKWDTIRSRFGSSGIQEPVLHGGKAVFSDDTQMTLFTAEGMTLGFWRSEERGTGAEVAWYVYQAYLCWLRTQGFEKKKKEPAEPLWEHTSDLISEPGLKVRRAPGSTCITALSDDRMGTIEDPLNNSKGCGGVMRTAPLGFMHCWGPPIIKGAEVGAITHGHPGGWMPAGMLSDIIFRIIYGESKPLNEIVEDSVRKMTDTWGGLWYTDEFAEMIREAVRLAATDMAEADVIHSIGGGWVGDEALAIAVYSCLKHPDDIRGALICAVNHSGDSDSTGAITGNILGAYLGYDAIPDEWIQTIEMKELILQEAEKIAKAAEYADKTYVNHSKEYL